MKRLLTLVLLVTAIMVMTLSAFATSRGRAYIYDGNYYDERVSTAAPGDTVYIALAEKSDKNADTKISGDYIPTAVKVTKAETIGYADDEKYKLISTGSLDIVTEETEDGVVWYFAELKINRIDVEDFPEDGCSVDGKIKVTRKSEKSYSLDLENVLESITYSEADNNNELAKTVQLYRIDGGDEIELEFPNGKGRFEAKAKRDINVLASMNHTKVSAITRKNDDATMTFFNGNGAEFKYVKNAKIIIDGDEDDYLYEINSKNSLTDISDCYDDDEDAFVIETDTLERYVLSDEKLSSSSSSDHIYTEDDDDDEDDNSNDNDFVLVNPSTGADA